MAWPRQPWPRTGCCYRLSIARWCSSTLEQGHRKAVVVYWVGREAAKNAKSTQQDNILPYRIRAPGGGVCMVCRFGDQCSEILPSEWFLAQKYFMRHVASGTGSCIVPISALHKHPRLTTQVQSRPTQGNHSLPQAVKCGGFIKESGTAVWSHE